MFGKKLDNEITWWSTVQGLEKIVPIEPATKHIPQWFKDTPRFTLNNEKENMFDRDKDPTVKSCPSFADFHRLGYVMKMWCDSKLTTWYENDIIQYKWETPNNELEWHFHGANQYIDNLPEHAKEQFKFVWKTGCPWRVKTPPGVSMIQMPMYYEYSPDFEVLPCIIDTDFHFELNQQVVVKRLGEIMIPRGTPLCMYIPIRREDYKTTITDETEELKKQRRISELNIFTRFNGLFGSYRETQQNMRNEGKYKCPINHKK